MPDQKDLNALRAIVGEPWIITSSTDRKSYEAAARYASGEAAAVVRLHDTQEVPAVVAYLVSRGLRFVPQSGNSGPVQGSVPDTTGAEFVLSLDRLRERLDVDPSDRSATVGAGVRLSELNLAAEPHGLFLPIDLGADPMIGGMVATNTGGRPVFPPRRDAQSCAGAYRGSSGRSGYRAGDRFGSSQGQ